MATISISGIQHTYELTPATDNPDSPVLVFIHGWLLSRRYWQPLITNLSDKYQCLIYDLRGFGESQTYLSHQNRNCLSNGEFSPGYTLADYAKDLKLLLQNLQIDNAWLIGHSLGGSIALWGADYCPEAVKGVICLNSGGGIYLKEEFERFRVAGQKLVQLRPRWLSYLPFIDLIFARAMVARPVARRWGRQRVIDFVVASREAALGSLLNSTTEEEVSLLPQILARLQQPVYFLAGTQDKIMELKYVCHLASFHKLFQNCANNVLEIPECGHFSMLEQTDFVCSKIYSILMHHGYLV